MSLAERLSELVISFLVSAASAVGGPPPAEAPQLDGLNAPATAADLGAPFDPCDPAMWDGVPAQVRPAQPKTPRNVPPKDPSPTPYMTCVLEDSAAVGHHGTMSIYVEWGESLAEIHGAQGTSYGGIPGTLKRDTDPNGQDRCSTRLHLPHGMAGVVALSRGAGMDACSVATAMSNHIATVAR